MNAVVYLVIFQYKFFLFPPNSLAIYSLWGFKRIIFPKESKQRERKPILGKSKDMGCFLWAVIIFSINKHICSSVQWLSCVRLCNPMNRSTPGLPVHHKLLEFTQTHVHRVSDAIQPSHPRLIVGFKTHGRRRVSKIGGKLDLC